MRERTELLKPPYRLTIGMIMSLVIATVLCGQELEFKDEQLHGNILQVADHFALSGDWKQAIMNYYAFLYQFPDDSDAVIIHLKIVEMYKRSGQLALAETNLQQIIEKYQTTKYDLENRLRWALFLYEQGRWNESLKYAYYQPEPPFRIIMAYSLIELQEIEMADSVLTTAQELTGIVLPISEKIHQLTVEPPKMPWFKKWGGLMMNVVLPGSGRLYYGDIKDGIFNMTGFTVLMGSTVYVAFQQPQWFFYTSAATIAYYLTNMYATFQSAEKYFEAYKSQRYADILNEFPLADLIPLRPLY